MTTTLQASHTSARPRETKVVLVGNPNVGKSVFFNALTGLYVDVSNYPGTTIDVSRGHFQGCQVLDTPGIYGVGAFNDEERVARDIVLGGDILLNVVSAPTLERDLFLTLQLIDLGKRVLVALNQMDEATQSGVQIDVAQLSALLGVEVVPCIAIRGEGLAQVSERIDFARTGHGVPGLGEKVAALGVSPASRAEALLALEGDPTAADRLGRNIASQREELYAARRAHVDEIVRRVMRFEDRQERLSSKLGHALLRPGWGFASAAAMMALLYLLVGDLIAQRVVEVTEGQWMQGHYEPWMRGLISSVVPLAWLREILVGEFGLLTMTVTYVFGLLLPLVAGFYLFLATLEDTGYLPRLAVLVDRSLAAIGLNGRAVIPLIIGFGCVTMATITTRLLGTQREKTIATAILGLTIPCSAQLGVILGLLGKTGTWSSWAVYGGTMFAVLVAIGTVLDRLLPGRSSALLIDLPPLRMPLWRNVLRKTWTKSLAFLQEAVPLFLLAALVVGVCKVTGLLGLITRGLAPLVEGLLHLPQQAASAFLMGLIRRDFGAAGLTDMALSPGQTVVALVVITLFVPCIATVVVLFKERGWREAAVLWLGSWVLAFAIGGVLARALGT
ncbi:MAG: ferrous iron transport protein B [Candidatus Sericytochromatia bacterium]|nr:ferrous iron transport protein B [Candidatus Sericytochromatia bacterium]